MKIVTNFITEVRNFSKVNWWVYLIYIVMLYAILLHDKNYLISVTVISSIHFIADIFIMMMFSAYNRKEFTLGTYFQITSLLMFLSIKIYTGFIGDGWHYLAADPIYILAAVKNYNLDVKEKNISWINTKTMFAISVVLIVCILLPLRTWFNIKLFSTFAQTVQSAGIFLFAIALATTNNQKLRYTLSIIALSAMVGGSLWETVNSFNSGKLVGLAVSYMLLPLTVLVFYLKSWSEIMKPKIKFNTNTNSINVG